jgi:D-alanyl-D-alanine dipeptidase
MIKFTSFLFIVLVSPKLISQDIPDGFVDLGTMDGIVLDIRYYTEDNFVGRRVDGYEAPKAYLSQEAAQSLQKALVALKAEGLGLKVYDGYRPQKAVDHFVKWAELPSDTLTKAKYYPEVDKKDVFDLGFVASRSGHSRGSTLDLTLVTLETGDEIDMGSGWDFFGDISSHGADGISAIQSTNRMRLKTVMEQHGFKAYAKEWWHYTLKNEPFPDTYFDFDVK